MTVITYKAPHLFLRFAELVVERRGWVIIGGTILGDLTRIKEMMVDYIAAKLSMADASTIERSSIKGDTPLKRFCDLLRDNEALLAMRDPGYAELHKISDACIAWAKVHCGVDLVERVRSVMRLKGPPMRSEE